MQIERNDMTKWLIHFVHKKDEESIPDDLPEKIEETICFPYTLSNYTPFLSLKNIIEEAGIRFGYSFRKKKTTIYGGNPVICFTEMPFFNYLQYLNSRNDNFISSYGIAIERKEAYELGARPVVYGLDSKNTFQYLTNNCFNRILDEKTFPILEQYRIVSYNPTKNIDWTHEREWRINCKEKSILYNEFNSNLYEIPGITIFDKETYSGRIILITNTLNEAKELQERVQILLDSNSNDYSTPFNNTNIYFLVVNKYKNFCIENNKQLFKIEDLPKDCYFKVNDYIKDEKLRNKIIKCINYARDNITVSASKEFIKNKGLKIENNQIDFKDCASWAKIICYHPNHQVLRELMDLKLANPCCAYYEIDAIGKNNIPYSQCISYHEYIVKKITEYLNEELENIFTDYSKPD